MEEEASSQASGGININREGTKVEQEVVTEFNLDGELTEETARALNLLNLGSRGGGINVTMKGGSVGKSTTSHISVINKRE